MDLDLLDALDEVEATGADEREPKRRKGDFADAGPSSAGELVPRHPLSEAPPAHVPKPSGIESGIPVDAVDSPEDTPNGSNAEQADGDAAGYSDGGADNVEFIENAESLEFELPDEVRSASEAPQARDGDVFASGRAVLPAARLGHFQQFEPAPKPAPRGPAELAAPDIAFAETARQMAELLRSKGVLAGPRAYERTSRALAGEEVWEGVSDERPLFERRALFEVLRRRIAAGERE